MNRTLLVLAGMAGCASAFPGPLFARSSAASELVYIGMHGNELTADLVTSRWNATTGTLTAIGQQRTHMTGKTGPTSGSEIIVSGDGRFLYVGSRSDNALFVYALDGISGKASQVQRLSSGGAVPWSFVLSPDGHWLLVCNEQSDKVRVFARNNRSGRLCKGQVVRTGSHPA